MTNSKFPTFGNQMFTVSKLKIWLDLILVCRKKNTLAQEKYTIGVVSGNNVPDSIEIGKMIS